MSFLPTKLNLIINNRDKNDLNYETFKEAANFNKLIIFFNISQAKQSRVLKFNYFNFIIAEQDVTI